ncbi:ABC transporter ATP-binding protein/permease [Salinispirillum sp. LH 10-3-1]|uniref:ABC transporter ATP-binding protein/permease n=1 Tax=Salinispirillum sp. LH 10-3-1 TaxID=2952525 RepID=A0AB38YKM9_9GAMM
MNKYRLDTLHDASRFGLLKRLWKDYVSKHVGLLSIAVVLMIIEGSMLGLLSYLVQPMFDTITTGGSIEQLTWVALGIFGVFTLKALGGFGQRSITITVGLRVITNMQKALLGHLIRLDSAFYSHHSPGALIERVRGDTQALKTFASNALISVGRDAVSLVALITVAVLVDWRWTLLAFLGAPLLVLPIAIVRRWILKTTRKARHVSSDMSTRLDEIFHGINAIKLNSLEAHEDARYRTVSDRYLKNQRRSEVGKAALPAMIDLLAGVGFMLVVLYGGRQLMAGEKTVGEFMSFFTAMGLMFDPLRRLSNISGALLAASASLERLYAVFDMKPEIVNKPKIKPIPSDIGQRELRVDSVVFGYGDQPVLNELSFVAPAGKMTAIVGPSGAGKTTVFSMLTRIIEPHAGGIYLGDDRIDEFDLQALRGQFAVVSQESALFDESIWQNIAFGRLDAKDHEVEAAAKAALVTDFTDLLPEGLHTLAGPRGSSLSGGQRQRVAIARALLRNAPILLLDEATSALDNRTEQIIQETLEKLARERTTLVIAHRLSTVMNADQIIVMEDGEVVEQGKHDELLARQGAYFRLHQTLAE